ncbi:MAG: AAA family ATPase [Clostridia bacterium]
MAWLVLMCGLPGSGKTTRARELERVLPALRLAPDEWLRELGLDGCDEVPAPGWSVSSAASPNGSWGWAAT